MYITSVCVSLLHPFVVPVVVFFLPARFLITWGSCTCCRINRLRERYRAHAEAGGFLRPRLVSGLTHYTVIYMNNIYIDAYIFSLGYTDNG